MTTQTIAIPTKLSVKLDYKSMAANAGRVLLGALFLLSMAGALHPDMRSQIRGAFAKDYRSIVSTAYGDLLSNGTKFTVIKVKTRESLLLEIYQAIDDGTTRLVRRIEMADKKDGYFNFNGQATNLAIDDIDGDGRPEIIAPSFDQNLVGHLNVFRYDSNAGDFQRVLE